MRAIAFSTFGPPEVRDTIDLPIPAPAEGEVVVRVKAAGVQSFDAKFRRGEFQGFVPATFPQRLGNEFSGVVHALGADISGWTVGDEVLGFTRNQAYAEYISVKASEITAKPDALSWRESGALTAGGQTAALALDALEVGPGDTLLLHAAAGGVGSMAGQLARLRGARVIGTASPSSHDYLRSMGVEPVTYGEGLVDRVRELAPDGVDAALDAVGGAANFASVELVRDLRRAGTIVDYSAAELGIRMLGGTRTADRLSWLASLVARGRLRVEISLAVELANAAEAHRAMDSGHTRGRIVLDIEE